MSWFQEERSLYFQVTDEDRRFINESTKLQSLSSLWKEMRVGRITASVPHDVLRTNYQNPSLSVIRKMCFRSYGSLKIPALRWGNYNENPELKTYVNVMRREHVNLTVRRTGLQLSQTCHFLAASGDAVASCDCHGDWLLAIKCPFKHKDASSLKEVLCDNEFCVSADLKKNHKYMTEVQMQMYVYDRSCHLVIWTPNVCHRILINYEEQFSTRIEKFMQF